MKKVAFVTGSTRGIGKAVALEFTKNNYIVVLNGTRITDYSQKLLKDIQKTSPSSEAYYFDISEIKQVERYCDEIINRFKRIDVLVNNAGILKDKSLVKMSYQDWDIVLKTNLYGPFFVTKQILPSMIENKFGRIINISSIIGLTGNFGQTNYSAAKAGLIGFTKSLSKETAKYNITVNAVCPGLVDTDILRNVPQDYMKKMLDKIPLKRMAHASEIAKLIIFLASEDSSYITGTVLNINGGWL